MRILFLTHAFNSLAQRLYVELAADGHELSVEFDINDRVTEEAVALWDPDLVVAPFLKRAIPASVWRRRRCLVVHPGIEGDRGPSALDWAIQGGERTWGVTVLEANGEMDAGPVWATESFTMREASKGSLYRNEVTEAAVRAVRTAIAHIDAGERPHAPACSTWRPLMRQDDRAIDWLRDDTARVLARIRAADGFPGVRDDVAGRPCHLFDAHREDGLGALRSGKAPGTIIAQRDGAICRATVDAAVWITHLKCVDAERRTFKLPAGHVLGDALRDVPEVPLAPDALASAATWQPVRYTEQGQVGFLAFAFYNGAMGTAQCEQLRAAYVAARARPTRVLVLTGGPDFWSNGIHLHRIEASAHPAEESWRNINAMNDLVREIIDTPDQLTVAAMRGNAGAGGAFLALAADIVQARSGVVLNPHYKGMGNLYGSEYWTYLLPRRVSRSVAERITQGRLPVAAREAVAMGLIDAAFGDSAAAFEREVATRAAALAREDGFPARIAAKRRARAADEAARPLEQYRADELARMKLNFFGFDPSYHVARYHFVHRLARSRTPLHLARHRRAGTRAPATAPGFA